MTDTVKSIDGVTIRLTDERWGHITGGHNELADMRLEVLETVANPIRILEDKGDATLAIREIEPGKFLGVFYKESGPDGFIITAYMTRQINSLIRRKQLWP